MSRLHYRTVFLSDIHLGFKDCRADYLLEFLNSIDCDTLYLIGDIVDLWSLKRRFFWPPSHYDVIRAIFKKSRHGTRVVYIPGNHDAPIRDYVKENFGTVEILEDTVHETADGRRLWLFHGDILDPHIRVSRLVKYAGDSLYDLLLRLTRLTNLLRSMAGREYWSLATFVKNRAGRVNQLIDTFARAAIEEAKQRNVDGVVCGHIHRPEMRMIDGLLYCNDGDWIENCSALTETADGQLQLLRWTDKPSVVVDIRKGLYEPAAAFQPLEKAS